MFAALLPSVVQLLPAAHGQPLGLGELCSVAGHVQAASSDNPGNSDTPDQNHQGHCLLCFLHAADLGLPPAIGQWQLPASAAIALPQAVSTLHASVVRLYPQSRGPPVFA
ncbi:hypothetical protein LT85_4166 [Collimonas arenae]|uniref:DUF2946 domain-containing protein n=2 Tax=Collimonas arenae TaxID=279058 RepID=A0A0A1FI67_9BURK|nr:hypothetical protein LT85_4166 [Collimonas arenae]